MLLVTVFGLPAHPLAVHLAVVLVPLAALALLGVGWNRAWRHRYYLPIAAVAFGGAVGAFAAQQTGGSLRRALRHAGKTAGSHPQQGNIAFVVSLLLAGTCIALCVYEAHGQDLRHWLRVPPRYRLPIDEDLALYLIAVPVAALAIITMVLAGHSGATLVWKTAGSVTPAAGQ